MMGYSCMKAVYEHTPYLHDREKYYYCTRPSGASPSAPRCITPDLRITSAPSAVNASTATKYDALTNCATGAG